MKEYIKKKSVQYPLLAVLVMSLLWLSVGTDSNFLQTSVLNLPEHASFDGTVSPFRSSPDWVHLSAERYNFAYDDLRDDEFVSDVPAYDPAKLKTSVDDLQWGNPDHDMIRNAKITYSVPYLGNYRLDGQEYVGSHPAVDIKLPWGTDIYAIANGVVTKAANQESGFGKHIVIQHNNVPSADSESRKETLYSAYAHLSSMTISEGDVVVKGQKIGEVGSSGTSSAAHLHFQIDNSEAPWHPYWPFTWKDAQDAGLDFYTAINAGLGMDKAKKLTLNPMLYVQRYATDGTYLATSSEDVDLGGTVASSYVEPSEEVVVADTVEPETPEVVVEPEPVVEVVADPPVLNFEFDVEPSYLYEGEAFDVKISLRDQYGNAYREGFAGDLLIATENNNVRVNKALVSALSFNSDYDTSKSFVVNKTGKDRFKIVNDGQVFTSEWFDVVKVEKDAIFVDVPNDHEFAQAIKALVDEGIVKGYDDGTFQPARTVSRVEALKFIFEGVNANLSSGDLPFSDLDKPSWYLDYLHTALGKNVVSGYDDGTFKPNNTVNKAEFYKMLFLGMDVKVEKSVTYSPYPDVKMTDWFAPYIVTAFDLGIIDNSVEYIKPNAKMTRGEVAYAIYKVMGL